MIDRDSFLFHIRAGLFRGMSASQVAGCNAILDAWSKVEPGDDLRFVAYALATAYHETATTMQPIEEYGRGQGHSYGVPCGPWNKTYYGRGLIQLTWITNYRKATAELRARKLIGGEDLERNPELALDPAIAAKVMIFGMVDGWFTGKKLADYFNAKIDNPTGARRIINGLDHAIDIARYHDAFLSALSA